MLDSTIREELHRTENQLDNKFESFLCLVAFQK